MVVTVITEAVSSMTGWLESGLDFHVSNDEEGMEGKSVILVSNGALKTALASSMKAVGMRVVSRTRVSWASTPSTETTQDAVRTAD